VKDLLAQVGAIVWKDLISEWRTKDIISSVFIFALLVIIIFNFAFEPGAEALAIVAPGVLWVAFTFAGVLGLNRSFVLEKDRGCLDGLLLCPTDRGAIYWGKMLGSFLFMLIVEAVALPIFSVLFNLPLFMPGLILIAFLATLGYTAVGTLLSAIAVNTRAREVMLPILLFPMVIPLIIAAVEATGVILGGAGGGIGSWLQLVLVFDVILLVVATLSFEFVVEE